LVPVTDVVMVMELELPDPGLAPSMVPGVM